MEHERGYERRTVGETRIETKCYELPFAEGVIKKSNPSAVESVCLQEPTAILSSTYVHYILTL